MRWLLILIIFLSACAPTPAYLVYFTSSTGKGHCAGFAINELEIVTANHCTYYGFNRVFKQNGEVVLVTVEKKWPDIDLVLLKASEPLNLSGYAKFGTSVAGDMGEFYGHCSVVPVNRTAFRLKQDGWLGRPYCTSWAVLWYACRGDSGGPMLKENGAVSGMQVAVWDWGTDNGFLDGNMICVVPAELIIEKLKEEISDESYRIFGCDCSFVPAHVFASAAWCSAG